MADNKRDADFTIGVDGQAGVSLVTDDDTDEPESDEPESDESDPDKPSD